MLLISYILFFIYYLTNYKIKSQTLCTSYIIYHNDKTYPRPILNANNGDVYAFSGTSSSNTDENKNAFLSIYNSAGELKESYIDLGFIMEENACIRQYSNQNFIAVSGKGSQNFNLIYFSKSGHIKTTPIVFENDIDAGKNIYSYVNSYKIDIYLDHEENAIVSYVRQYGEYEAYKASFWRTIYIQKFKLNEANFMYERVGQNKKINTNNLFISCVEMGETIDYRIACQYVKPNCLETVSIFKKDLSEQTEKTIETSTNCSFDKIIKLDSQHIAATYQSGTTMKYSIMKINSNSEEFVEWNTHKIFTVEGLSSCILDTNKVDTAKWDSNTFVFTCVNNSKETEDSVPNPAYQVIHVGIVSFDSSNNETFTKKHFTTKYAYSDYPYISKFGHDYMSIFYHYQTHNVFEIIGFPACNDVDTQLIYINSFTQELFTLENYVTEGAGDIKMVGTSIAIHFPNEFPNGQLFSVDDSGNETPIKYGKDENNLEIIYNANTKLRFRSGYQYGIFNLQFQPVSTIENGEYNFGKFCWITFKVSDCYEGCKTCLSYSNDKDNQMCKECDDDQKYYIYSYGDETVNCENIYEIDNYYFAGDTFIPCHRNCKKCKYSGNDNYNNCTVCKLSDTNEVINILYETTPQTNTKYNCITKGPESKICGDGYFYTTVTEKSEVVSYNEVDVTIFNEVTGQIEIKKKNETVIKTNQDVTYEKCGKCYSKCLTCSDYGTEEEMKCDTCITSELGQLYKIEGETNGNCYLAPKIGYYLEDNLLKKCHDKCSKCTSLGTDTEMKCTECKVGYLKEDDTSGNCYIEPQQGYYLNTVDKIFEKCFPGCLTCFESYRTAVINNLDARLSDFHCTTCDQTDNEHKYYFLIGTNNCYAEEPIVKVGDVVLNYFVQKDPVDDEPNWKWNQCYINCATCSDTGTTSEMNCITCKINYYKLNDRRSFCYDDDSVPDNYKLNTSDNMYYHCNIACKKCTQFSDLVDNTYCEARQCTYNTSPDHTPLQIYGYLVDNQTQCYIKNPDNPYYIDGYYYTEDDGVRVFKKCADGCKTCIGNTRDDCTSCLNNNNYYQKLIEKGNTKFRCYEHPVEVTNYYITTDPNDDSDPIEYVKECYISCSQCREGGTVDDNNCDACKTNYYPLSDVEKSCRQNPDKYYPVTEDGNTIYYPCYTTCLKCDSLGTPSDHLCTECLEGFTQDNEKIIDGKTYFNCIRTCPVDTYYRPESMSDGCNDCNLPKEFISGIYCINCMKTYSKYRIIPNNECVLKSDYPNYFVSDEENGIIEPCESTCATCSKAGESITNSDGSIIFVENCDSCSGDLYLKDKSCVSDCGIKLIGISNVCVNCKSINKYKYISDNTKCYTRDEIDALPNPTKNIDPDYNLIVPLVCTEPCLDCTFDSDNNQLCLSCADSYYTQYDPNPTPSYVDCQRDTCGTTYPYVVKDPSTNSCINCKKRNDAYVNFYEGRCVDKINDPTFSNFYESTDDDKEPFGVIEECYNECSTCQKGSEIIDGELVMNCDTCKRYYHQLLPGTNCVESCERHLGEDNSNENNKWCVNCKEKISGRGLPMYKYIGTSGLYSTTECIISKPSGTFISDPIYNTLDDCDISCKNCDTSAISCIECAEGYIRHPFDESRCVLKCDTNYWYIDNDNNYICIDDCSEITTLNRPYIGGNQCVEKCTDEKCAFCKKNDAHVLYDKYCKFRCPKGYKENNNKVCELIIPTEDGCNIKKHPARHSTLISKLKLYAFEWIEDYIFNYPTSLMKNVDILPAHNMTMQIWKDDECEKEASLKYDISFVNTSICRKKLQEVYSLPENGILFVKFDINRTSMLNQVHYNAYNAFNGQKLNLSYCDGDIIDYSFIERGANFDLAKKLYDKLGVDIFNSSDDFFNDNCFQFDDQGKDVLLEERRLYYFQNVPLCESGCTYSGTNYENGTLRCICEHSLPTLEEAEELSDPSVNDGNFTKKIKDNNINLMKCYNLVFSWNNFKKNTGSHVMLCLFGSQLILFFNLVYRGFKPIYSFLNQFTYLTQNPPKKRNNFIDDNTESLNNYNTKYTKSSNDIEYEENDNEIITNTISNKKSKKGYSKSFGNETETNTTGINKNYRTTRSNRSNIRNEKLKMKDAIHLTSTTDNIMVTSTQTLKKNKKENIDAEVEGFDEDEMDELLLNDALEFDDRNFISFLWRVIKKKVFWLFPISDISVFEPLPIKLIWFILLCSNFFFFNAVFFQRKYIKQRFYTLEKIDFKYFVKHEIQISVFSSIISCLIGIILSIFISIKKQFVICIRTIKERELFLLEVKKIMSCYKKKIIIFLLIDFFGMLLFWYFCTAFCAMYLKAVKAWFYAFIFTAIFATIIQLLYSIIITSFRYIGKFFGIKCIYKISQFLL